MLCVADQVLYSVVEAIDGARLRLMPWTIRLGEVYIGRELTDDEVRGFIMYGETLDLRDISARK
jgi:hypothetical protein